jgi:acetyl esterase/lipase
MRNIPVLIFLLFFIHADGQAPYTQSLFPVYVSDTNLVYKVDTGFAGNADTLEMDIYKPLGDGNCLRPLLILVHGGSWTGGSKNDGSIVSIAGQMAAKGYVVATINYRLGMHKTSNYSMYWACNNSISAPCVYVADSAEVIRAIYRGMQDTRAAIRFMKSRASVDSTDTDNTFLAGESAGAFNVLSAGFMTHESQKPAACYSLADAPAPDPDLVFCNPPGYSLSRPDMGSIEGMISDSLQNSSVKGVASFYGAMIDTSLLSFQGQKPAVYLFHQGSDVVVHYQSARILERINVECYAPSSICQPYPHMPTAYGGEAIRQKLVDMGSAAPLFQADIIYNFNYGNDCFANGHSIDNLSLRTTQMANLFSTVILSSGNDPSVNCQITGSGRHRMEAEIVYPNPARNYINIKTGLLIPGSVFRLIDLSGREMSIQYSAQPDPVITFKENVVPGIYFLQMISDERVLTKKIMIY